MKKKSFLPWFSFLVVSICLFSSCKKPTLGPFEIDGLINMYLEEYARADSSTLLLNIFTEKNWECFNYTVLNDLEITGSTATINISGVMGPEVCLTAEGPAKGIISFPEMAFGNYSVIASVENKTINGSLEIDPAFFELNWDNNNEILMHNTKLMRIPQNIYWIDFYCLNNNGEAYYSDLVDTLSGMQTNFATLDEGHYLYFDVNSNNEVVQPGPGSFTYGQRLLINANTDLADILGLLEDVALQQFGQIRIEVRGRQGEFWAFQY